MRFDIGGPHERARLPVYRYDVGAIVGCCRISLSPSNQFIPVYGRTDSRNGSREPIVVGYLMGPDELTGFLLHSVEIACPIGEIDRVTRHGGSGGDASTRCESPGQVDVTDIGRID